MWWMPYFFFILGMFETFKTGPIQVGGVLSPSDFACFGAVALYGGFHLKTLIQQNRILTLSISPVILVIFGAYLLNAFVITYLTGFSGPNLTHVVTMTLATAAAASLYQVLRFHLDSEEAERCIYTFGFGVVVGLTIPFAFPLAHLASHNDVYFFPGNRYKGFLPHMNMMGLEASFILTFLLFASQKQSTKLMMLVLSAVPLLLCGSKFNLALCVAVTCAYYLWNALPISKIGRLITVAAAGIAVMPLMQFLLPLGIQLLLLVNPENAKRLTEFSANPEGDETFTDRVYIWNEAITEGTAHLPFGIGPSEAPYYLKGLSHAHNAFLNAYLVYGIPGCAFLASVVVMILLLIFRNTQRNSMVYAAGFSAAAQFLAALVSDSYSTTTATMGLTMIALGWGLNLNRRTAPQVATQPMAKPVLPGEPLAAAIGPLPNIAE